ncbi:hypothetical protein EXIGLDRAFT_691123 [Exidia glandulosa HHB12029]|uniref:Uncharacterized protein n=1 Tax=Exidia glandulosa HHB12029 TaxID=1314781 RepID=A0A165IVM5_EXIGL|nr:hypothetical protein EXIGLDRAFT_691123 [Exidia glandulosa HHB12029]
MRAPEHFAFTLYESRPIDKTSDFAGLCTSCALRERADMSYAKVRGAGKSFASPARRPDRFNLEGLSEYALLASSGCYRLPGGLSFASSLPTRPTSAPIPRNARGWTMARPPPSVLERASAPGARSLVEAYGQAFATQHTVDIPPVRLPAVTHIFAHPAARPAASPSQGFSPAAPSPTTAYSGTGLDDNPFDVEDDGVAPLSNVTSVYGMREDEDEIVSAAWDQLGSTRCVWDVSNLASIREVLNLNTLALSLGSVLRAVILPTPEGDDDAWADQRPLLGLITRRRSNELVAYSLRTHCVVHRVPVPGADALSASAQFLVVGAAQPHARMSSARHYSSSLPGTAPDLFSIGDISGCVAWGAKSAQPRSRHGSASTPGSALYTSHSS